MVAKKKTAVASKEKATKANSKAVAKATPAKAADDNKPTSKKKSSSSSDTVTTTKKTKVVLKTAFLTSERYKKSVMTIEDKSVLTPYVEPTGTDINDLPETSILADASNGTSSALPRGKPKSGRDWKSEQTVRHSAILRQGTISNLSKTQTQHAAERARKKQLKELESSMKEEKRQKILDAKQKREDQTKRREANSLRTAATQNINPEKLKGMSKKQLRNIRKTAMGKNGQIELVPAYV